MPLSAPSSSVIEAALLKAAEADSAMVTEAAQHIIAAGGKRFRPLLVVLGSYLGPTPRPTDVVKAAVGRRTHPCGEPVPRRRDG